MESGVRDRNLLAGIWKSYLGAIPYIAKIEECMNATKEEIIISMPINKSVIKAGFTMVP
jgi:hypothetical protein